MLTETQCYLLLAFGVAFNVAIWGYSIRRLMQIKPETRTNRALARYLGVK